MKKIYSTPVSIETKTRIRASILAGSVKGTPNPAAPTDLGGSETLDAQNDGLGARRRFSFD